MEGPIISQENPVLNLLGQIFDEAQNNHEIDSNANPEDLMIALFGAGVGIALFQYGIQRGSLIGAMDIFVDISEARLFPPLNPE
ncbi:MAG: hypothetical protein ACR2PS_17150 [Pseudomonadales bacterium]